MGWIVDVFLIPSMARSANWRYREGYYDYTIAWVLLTFLGAFGVHRLFLGKWISGIIYFFTVGLFLVGVLYDFWTLNEQVAIRNEQIERGQ